METFLHIVHSISDNRFWLMPLLLVGVLILLVRELIAFFKDLREEMRK